MEIWWTTLGFQKPYDLESKLSLEDAYEKARVECDANPEAPGVIVQFTRSPGETAKPTIVEEFNGGLEWVRDSLEPVPEHILNAPTVVS